MALRRNLGPAGRSAAAPLGAERQAGVRLSLRARRRVTRSNLAVGVVSVWRDPRLGCEVGDVTDDVNAPKLDVQASEVPAPVGSPGATALVPQPVIG